MSKMNKPVVLICLLLMGLVLVAGIALGNQNITFSDTLAIIGHKLFQIPLNESIDSKYVTIIWNLRLPRVLLAFLVGGALGASGAMVQSVLKNELASPYTLGVSSGASFCVGLLIVLSVQIPLFGQLAFPIFGFIGGIITLFGVLAFAKRLDANLGNTTIILTGMVFSLFINGGLTLLSAIYSKDMQAIILWQMGSFATRGWAYVGYMLPFALIGLLGGLRYSREMDLLSFGEEEATALGVDAPRVKRWLFIFSAILTGAAVALSGVIGFVDLIAPHIVRKYFGMSHKKVVPLSFIFGGLLMICSDLLARSIRAQSELPVGAITALIGAPFFAYVYFRKRR